MLSSGVFRRETASGFYPWGNVDSPRKRVAEGLCGWRHGNSFPMAQSAQSLRQMRSIPLCPKAVFYVFYSIDDSATMLNPSPSKFPTEQKKAAGTVTSAPGKNYSDIGLLQFGEGCCDACGGFHNVFIAGGVTHANVAWARAVSYTHLTLPTILLV